MMRVPFSEVIRNDACPSHLTFIVFPSFIFSHLEDKFNQAACRYTCGALAIIASWLIQERRTCNIKVNPRRFAGKFTYEKSGGNGTGFPTSGILEISHITFVLFLIFFIHG